MNKCALVYYFSCFLGIYSSIMLKMYWPCWIKIIVTTLVCCVPCGLPIFFCLVKPVFFIVLHRMQPYLQQLFLFFLRLDYLYFFIHSELALVIFPWARYWELCRQRINLLPESIAIVLREHVWLIISTIFSYNFGWLFVFICFFINGL